MKKAWVAVRTSDYKVIRFFESQPGAKPFKISYEDGDWVLWFKVKAATKLGLKMITKMLTNTAHRIEALE